MSELQLTRFELQRYARDYGIGTVAMDGVSVDPIATMFCRPEWASDFTAAHELMAMDAQPGLVTAPSGAAGPAFLFAQIDPVILEIRTAPNEATSIFPERAAGSWIDETWIFPVVEHTGEVTAYGDENEGGMASVNTNFETRQSFVYQIMMQYGDREVARAGRAKIGWVNELRASAAMLLGKADNLFYFRGVQGLANYGIQNDPNLYPSIAPAPKANGGLGWLTASGAPNATANEIYADIQALVNQAIAQGGGQITPKSKFVLALSPRSEGALTATNSFAVNVMQLLEKNYPNMKIVAAVQYGALSAQNTQGLATGEMVQLVAVDATGQDTGWTAFNAKMMAGPIIRRETSYRQKLWSGTWGAILRQPFAISSMIGV
jgi:hypothetical protein